MIALLLCYNIYVTLIFALLLYYNIYVTLILVSLLYYNICATSYILLPFFLLTFLRYNGTYTENSYKMISCNIRITTMPSKGILMKMSQISANELFVHIVYSG